MMRRRVGASTLVYEQGLAGVEMDAAVRRSAIAGESGRAGPFVNIDAFLAPDQDREVRDALSLAVVIGAQLYVAL